jgi:hypothetical protein
MWTTSHEGTTTATPEAVWDALAALHSGTKLGPNSDTFELHGPLAVGTTLTVTPQGQEPVQSTIIVCEPGKTYADETVLGDVSLVFRFDFAAQADGTTRVTHTLDVTGPAADQLGPELGPQISADFPATMAELLAAAERGVGGADQS